MVAIVLFMQLFDYYFPVQPMFSLSGSCLPIRTITFEVYMWLKDSSDVVPVKLRMSSDGSNELFLRFNMYHNHEDSVFLRNDRVELGYRRSIIKSTYGFFSAGPMLSLNKEKQLKMGSFAGYMYDRHFFNAGVSLYLEDIYLKPFDMSGYRFSYSLYANAYFFDRIQAGLEWFGTNQLYSAVSIRWSFMFIRFFYGEESFGVGINMMY